MVILINSFCFYFEGLFYQFCYCQKLPPPVKSTTTIATTTRCWPIVVKIRKSHWEPKRKERNILEKNRCCEEICTWLSVEAIDYELNRY